MFSTPGALLSPFAGVTHPFCSSFNGDARWGAMSSMSQMAAGCHNLALPPALPRQCLPPPPPQSMTPPAGAMTSLHSAVPPSLGGGVAAAVPSAAAAGAMNLNVSACAGMYSPPPLPPHYGMTSSSSSACESPLSSGMMMSNVMTSAAAGALNGCQMGVGGGGESGDMWRGTSIASLRQKALEHTASLTGINGFR